MRIGTYPLSGAASAEERLHIIKDAGFDFVCLGMKSMFESNGFTPELCGKIGIGFDNVHLICNGTTKIWSAGEEGERLTESYCDQIKRASEYGLHIGIVHVTWGAKTIPELPGDTGMARYYRIAECADKYNFRLAVENSVYPDYLYYVLDRITAPVFGYCFDCGHQNAFAPREDFLGKYGNRLIATHIHDNDGANDLHIMPFDGSIDWQKLASKLAKNPYARENITTEFGSAHTVKFPGKSAAELEGIVSKLKIAGTDMVTIRNGEIGFYQNMKYEDMVERIFSAMKRFSLMIEAEAEKISTGVQS